MLLLMGSPSGCTVPDEPTERFYQLHYPDSEVFMPEPSGPAKNKKTFKNGLFVPWIQMNFYLNPDGPAPNYLQRLFVILSNL